MKKYELIRDNLKAGQRITLVSQSDFGGLYIIQTTFDHAEPTPHYQNCPQNMYGVRIYHTPKRKRTLCVSTIDYDAPIIVYNGWIDIDRDALLFVKQPLTDKDKVAGVTEIRVGKYLSFDNRYFRDCLASYPDPIISDIEEDINHETA